MGARFGFGGQCRIPDGFGFDRGEHSRSDSKKCLDDGRVELAATLPDHLQQGASANVTVQDLGDIREVPNAAVDRNRLPGNGRDSLAVPSSDEVSQALADSFGHSQPLGEPAGGFAVGGNRQFKECPASGQHPQDHADALQRRPVLGEMEQQRAEELLRPARIDRLEHCFHPDLVPAHGLR